MSKFLILDFKNSGLFRTNRNTKDKIIINDGRVCRKYERSIEDEFDEPITVHQISNLLHVLFGERPVPKNKPVCYNVIDHYFEMASNSFLKINNFIDGGGNFVSEKIRLNKSSWDAKAETKMNWELTRRLLDEHYEIFLEMVKDVFNHTPKTITFNELCNLIKKSKDRRVGEVFDFLKSKRKISFYNYIFMGNKSEVSANGRIRLTLLNGIDNKNVFEGSIIVPVNDDDIIKLKNSKGCGTLLDGGAVFIKGVKYNGVDTYGYVPVKEISLEKRKEIKK
jgi:hypothetical protein